MGEVLRWVACGGVGGLAALFLVDTWLFAIDTIRTGRPISLVLPFLCGPACAAACWFSPSAFLQRWFWMPCVLDLSILMSVCFAFAASVRWIVGPQCPDGPGVEPDDVPASGHR